MTQSSDLTIRAAIFDMDGLLINSNVVGFANFKRASAEFGYTVTLEQFIPLLGLNWPISTSMFLSIFGAEFPVEKVIKRHREFWDEFLQTKVPDIMPGAKELLQYLAEQKIPCIVATSTREHIAKKELGGLGILKYFQAIVGGEQVTKSKPEPDIFIHAAKTLNVPSAECIVLEDSEAGIMAAHKAGCIPIMVPDFKQPSEEIRSIAHHVFASLFEVKEWLKQAFPL